MSMYESLSPELSKQIELDLRNNTYPPVAFDDRKVIRRRPSSHATIWRPPFVQDIDKIMHCPYYNRYTDKTQVFSLMKNDDITRRSLHVQLVSRIARTIGRALHLNLDLIEAIALGHDLGHTPFAHAGEQYLDELFYWYAGRHFNHGIHSVRVLDGIFDLNISLQTLDGIACHNGEVELAEYVPTALENFSQLDAKLETCYEDRAYVNKLVPSTLEANVVRISDIIAYLGKDRQDAMCLKFVDEDAFVGGGIGDVNGEIMNNLVVSIIENSYGKPYIKMGAEHFEALRVAKRDNYSIIYNSDAAGNRLSETVKPMMGEIYGQLLDDLTQDRRSSPIFAHLIRYVNEHAGKRATPYGKEDPNQIVVDYIASMTDDYFVDLHHYLFPDSHLKVEYIGYFDEMRTQHV